MQNKTISTDPDAMLTLQGVSWFTRKAIALATVTLAVTQYADAKDKNLIHIDIKQTVTGGIAATPEFRTLDWTLRPHSDRIFGELEGKSRFVALAKLRDEGEWDDLDFLGEGWEASPGGAFVQSWVENKEYGWTANQVSAETVVADLLAQC